MKTILKRPRISLAAMALITMATEASAAPSRSGDMHLAQAVVSPARDMRQDLDRLQHQQQQGHIQQEIEREREIQEQNRAAAPEAAASAPASEKGMKFPISDIVLLGDDDPGPEVETILAGFRGTQMGSAEIMQVVRALTNHYISKGFVTTVVTVRPGKLTDGKLELEVKWGTIRGVTIDGKAPEGVRDHLRLFSALPFAEGDVLRMDDIDQAVDNLMKAGGSDKIRIIAADDLGGSRLDVVTSAPRTFALSAGINNSGQQQEGWNQYSGSLGVNNLLGLNDTLSTYYAQQDYKDPDNLQQIASINYSVPIGKWGIDASWYGSRYEKNIGGDFGRYLSEGSSQRYNLRASRMLNRDASGKTSAYVKVGVRDNENSIAGRELEVSTKIYSELTGGMTHVGTLGGGWLYGDLSLTAGVPWFGAAWRNDPDLAAFDTDYIKLNGMLTWSRPFKVAGVDFQYELGSGFQYSENSMVTDAQLSLGDEYTVRGFKDIAFYGDSGAWMSNTLRLPLRTAMLGGMELAPFVGYDMGFVNANRPGQAPDYLIGAAVGLRFSGKYFSSSLTYGWPLMAPDQPQPLSKAINYRLDLRY